MDERSDSYTDEFPVNFEALWPLLGFLRRDLAKNQFEIYSVEKIDFQVVAEEGNKISLSLQSAKRFAAKCGSKSLVDFFVCVAALTRDYHSLAMQFEAQGRAVNARHDALMATIVKGKHYFYSGDLGVIGGKRRIKAGSTNDGYARFIFPNGFKLCCLIEHHGNRELERKFKEHPLACVYRESLTLGGETYTECWKVEGEMSIEKYGKIAAKLAKTTPVSANQSHDETMMTLKTRQMEIELEMLKFRSKDGQGSPNSHANVTTDEQFEMTPATPPEFVREVIQPTTYELYSNRRHREIPFDAFIEEHYELTNNLKDIIAKKDVNDHFFSWCNRSGLQHQILRRNLALGSLKQAMRDYGFCLAEAQGRDGKLVELKKRPHGCIHPVVVYGRIKLKRSTG